MPICDFTDNEIRVAFMVHKAALLFQDAARPEFKLSKETKDSGFGIGADDLASLARRHDAKGFRIHGGVEGITKKVSTSLQDGIRSSDATSRREFYGANRFTEKRPRGFWTFVWEAFQELTLILLMVCAVVSIGVGVATEGLPKGRYDGVGNLCGMAEEHLPHLFFSCVYSQMCRVHGCQFISLINRSLTGG